MKKIILTLLVSVCMVSIVNAYSGDGLGDYKAKKDLNMNSKKISAADSLDTGYGDNELHPMDQPVRTTDNPTFVALTLSSFTVNGQQYWVGSINGSVTFISSATFLDNIVTNGAFRGAEYTDVSGTRVLMKAESSSSMGINSDSDYTNVYLRGSNYYIGSGATRSSWTVILLDLNNNFRAAETITADNVNYTSGTVSGVQKVGELATGTIPMHYMGCSFDAALLLKTPTYGDNISGYETWWSTDTYTRWTSTGPGPCDYRVGSTGATP